MRKEMNKGIITLCCLLLIIIASCGNGSQNSNYNPSDTMVNNAKFLVKPYYNGETYLTSKIDSSGPNFVSFTSDGKKISVHGSYVIEEN